MSETTTIKVKQFADVFVGVKDQFIVLTLEKGDQKLQTLLSKEDVDTLQNFLLSNKLS